MRTDFLSLRCVNKSCNSQLAENSLDSVILNTQKSGENLVKAPVTPSEASQQMQFLSTSASKCSPSLCCNKSLDFKGSKYKLSTNQYTNCSLPYDNISFLLEI